MTFLSSSQKGPIYVSGTDKKENGACSKPVIISAAYFNLFFSAIDSLFWFLSAWAEPWQVLWGVGDVLL